MSIASDGAVATVAVFTRKPISQVRTIALDLSSRTSVALTRVLCAKHWHIEPSFTPAEPDLEAMLGRADAALVIGDPAFAIDPRRRAVTKIDLGAEWKAMTGLPFVYAMWVGRPGAATPAQCRALQEARDRGVEHLPDIADAVSGGDPDLEQRSLIYLRDNLKYSLGDRRGRDCADFMSSRLKSASCRRCGRCVFYRSRTRIEVFSSVFCSKHTMDLSSFEQRIAAGDRLTGDEALQLYRHAPTYWLGRMADQVRQRKHPDGLVTYIIDRNVNYTNVCVARCNFCAFYREVGHGDGYVLAFDEIFKKIEETRALGGVQLLLQGGHNPDLPLAWYEDLFRAVKQRFPDFKLHALSPPEVLHISRMAKLPVPEVIARLIAAGLDSIPGGGAEILVDRVRKLLNCYSKASADEWLDVMRHAHRAGLRTTATMMYGTVETDEERLEHLLRLRAVQDETGGFTAFITWSYQPEHTERGGTEATGIDYLRTLAIARLVLDNFDNLQASWVTQGGKVGQLSLAFGANDMGSVMIEENVVRAAGASYCMDEVEIVRNVEDAGLRAEAAQHALRDSRRPVLPRARRAAHAGAVDGARGR